MPWMARLAVPALVAVALAACGQLEPVLLPVSMPDCTHGGPASMREGEARLVLTLNGLADVGVELVELTGGHDFGDLAEHIEMSPRLDRLPRWVTQIASLRIEDGIGVDGVEETLQLEEGLYALVCVVYPHDDPPFTVPAAPLRVRAA